MQDICHSLIFMLNYPIKLLNRDEKVALDAWERSKPCSIMEGIFRVLLKIGFEG
jgi:hypothetical protein